MTLCYFIKNEPLATTIFGKAEIKIIQKQLLGINLTQSEKNRLSRNIRPKLKFVKACSVFKEEFELKKGGEVFQQIEQTKNVLLLDALSRKIKRIFVFGSFIENLMTESSDIDVAVEFSEISKKEASLLKKRIITQLPKLIDLSIFNTLPEKIQENILKNGKTIYEINGRNTSIKKMANSIRKNNPRNVQRI